MLLNRVVILGFRILVFLYVLQNASRESQITKITFRVFPGESMGQEFIPSQSELFRFIPISVSEPIRIIPDQSEKRFVSRLMKYGKKPNLLNPI